MFRSRILRALIFSSVAVGLSISASNLAMGQSSLASRATVPRLHVVVLGVSQYRRLNKLVAATQDAMLVANAFQELGSRTQLLSFTALYEPTRAQIISTLTEVAAQARASRETVVVYWAGHSHYDQKNDRLYLAPTDTEQVEGSQSDAVAFRNAIEFSDDFLSLFANDAKLLFFGDGCNIGEGLVGQVAKKYPNLVVFSSSKVDEEVMDAVPGLNHGALAYYLAEALRNPIVDIDGDGVLSVDDLFIHIYPRVVDAVRKSALSFSQHPTIFGRYSHRLQIAAALAPIAPGSRVALNFAGGVPPEIRSTSLVRFNGQDVPVAVSADAATIEVGIDDERKLAPGLNEISWGDEGQKFLVWKERRDLSRFDKPYRKSHAVLIAIDDYAPADLPRTESLKKLGGMVAQAKKLGEILVKELGFDLLVELYDKKATRQRIDDVLRSYWQGGENEDVDRLFVYYGGHGLSGKDAAGREQSLLATYDYDLTKKTTTAFHTNDLKGRHSENIAANHVMFALDVCHSGLITTKLSRNEQRLAATDSRLALVRAEIQQKARNFLVAGTSDQEALYDGGGVFTKKLIEALQGEADDGDGLLTFNEVGQWVRNAVIRLTQTDPKLRGQRQEPDFERLSAIGRGQILFFPGSTVRLVAKPAPSVSAQEMLVQ